MECNGKMQGPALVAEQSKALQLTARCLSPMHRYKSWPASEKVASDLDLSGISLFPSPLTTCVDNNESIFKL